MSNDLDGRRMSRVITPNVSDFTKKIIFKLLTALLKFFGEILTMVVYKMSDLP